MEAVFADIKKALGKCLFYNCNLLPLCAHSRPSALSTHHAIHGADQRSAVTVNGICGKDSADRNRGNQNDREQIRG